MPASTAALPIFRILAAEFSGVDNATVALWLELTEPLVSRKRFGKLWTQALVLLTAHRMKQAGVGEADGGGGVLDGLTEIKAAGIASYSEGETSISFASSSATTPTVDTDYAATTYGLQYLALRKLATIPIISAGEADASNGY